MRGGSVTTELDVFKPVGEAVARRRPHKQRGGGRVYNRRGKISFESLIHGLGWNLPPTTIASIDMVVEVEQA